MLLTFIGYSLVAGILALLTPAIYISLMAFNIEAIPSGLLINLSIQRDGVPFSTLFEILVMSFMFQMMMKRKRYMSAQ